MLFNTPEYAVFFTIVLAIYFVLPFRRQNVWLLAASYLFYGSWDWRFLSLLLLSTVIDYTAGLLIQAARERADHPAMKRGVHRFHGVWTPRLPTLDIVRARNLVATEQPYTALPVETPLADALAATRRTARRAAERRRIRARECP